MDEEKFMGIAIEEAKKAFESGENTGIGALIVRGEEIVSQCHNNVKITEDSTNHDEMNVIRDASKKLKRRNLNDCTLFTTCEPCPMCFAAAWWARIPKIVFGASLDDLIDRGNREIKVSSEFLNNNATYKIEIIKGVLRKECIKINSNRH